MNLIDVSSQDILSLILDLSQNSDHEHTITRFIDSFREFWPDVHIHFTKEACAESPACLLVESGDSQFGHIVVDEFQELSDRNQILIRNAILMLGVILQKQEQETLLNNEKHLLQSIVDEQTSDLLAQKSLLEQITESYPNSYLSIIENDFTVGFSSGQEFKKANLDPKTFVGLTLQQVFGEHAPVVKEYYAKTFEGKEQRFELYINDQYQSYKTVPLLSETADINRILVVVENITDRKKIELQLRDSQKHLSAVFDNTRDLQLLLKYEGPKKFRIVAANRSYINVCNQYGLELRETDFVGQSLVDLLITILGLDENVKRYTLANYQQAIDTGEPVEYEESIVVLGKSYHSEITLSPISDAVDGQQYVLYSSHDVTAEREATRLLQESEERYRFLVDNTPDFIYSFDRESRHTAINKSVCDAMGLPEDQIVGKTYAELGFSEKIAKEWQTLHQMVFSSKKPVETETTTVMPDGAVYTYWVALNPVFDEKGDVIDIRGTSRDITEHKKAEHDLRESERKYRLLVENLSEGIWYIDKDASTTYVNQRMADMLGYTISELQGKPLFEFMDERGKDIAQRKLKERRQGIQEQHDFEFIRKDGKRIHTLIETTPVLDEDGCYIGALAGALDITERRETEEALKISEEKFRGIYEQSPIAIEIYSRDGILVDVNQTTLDMFGISDKKYVLGFDLWADPNLSEEKMELLKNGQPIFISTAFDFELVKKHNLYPTSRNGMMYMDMYAIPLLHEKEITGYLIQIVELTERKQAEIALRESEERFSTIFRVSPIATSLSGPDHKYTEVNQAWCNLLGYSRKEAIGHTPVELGIITAETGDIISKTYRDTGLLKNYEMRLRTKKGEIKDTLSSSEYISIGGERYTLNITVDITERKQMLKTLQDRNTYIETILENMPIGFALNTIDDGDVKYMNNLFEGIYGWPREVLTNISIFFEKVFPEPEFREKMKTKIISDMESGDPERMRWNDLKIVTNTGEARYVYAFNIPLVDQNLMISTVQDTTKRKLAEDQIRHALREKETLLRELYHRTKNNMNVISSMLKLHAAYSRNQDVERIVIELDHKIQAMALVHQKLYQSQNLSRIQLQEYLSELAHLLLESSVISPSGIVLKLNIAPVSVLIDTAIPCGLILNELLSNAFRHAFPNGKSGEIQIQLTKDDQGLITLQVSDNGVGVPPGFDFRAQDTLGLQSIVMIGEHQLQGKVTFIAGKGVTCLIQFTDVFYQPRV